MRVRRIVAVLAVAATAASVAARVPGALRGYSRGASYGSAQSAFGGALAGADSLDIDNVFVQQAIELIPAHARFAMWIPPSQAAAQQSYGMDPLTQLGFENFMTEVLLPRLPVRDPAVGDYVLCYGCDRSARGSTVRWLWTNGAAYGIGEMTG